MIIGDIGRFALESRIDEFHSASSMLGLGAFKVHVNGRPYGRSARIATSLGCARSAVVDRLAKRGTHTLAWAATMSARNIVRAFRDGEYGSHDVMEGFEDSADDPSVAM